MSFPKILKGCLCLFGALAIFTGASCTAQIPEGDIKEFVDRIDFDRAFENVKTGKSVITSTYFANELQEGQLIQTTLIDTINSYYYINIDVTGNYQSDYPYSNQQLLAYMDIDANPVVFKKQDGIKEDLSYRQEDVLKAVQNFFYNELEAGYHRGGAYYGDYIIANCAKFYTCFSLNEAKTELSYNVNTSSKNSEGDEIVTMHSFTVDVYGMILSLTSKSIMVEKNIVIETTMSCEYNFSLEKINEL